MWFFQIYSLLLTWTVEWKTYCGDTKGVYAVRHGCELVPNGRLFYPWLYLGTFSPENDDTYYQWPPGTYQNLKGQDFCHDSPFGYYVSEYKQDKPIKWSSDNYTWSGNTSCWVCDADEYRYAFYQKLFEFIYHLQSYVLKD